MYARTTMRVPNACARMFVCMRGNSSCVDGASNENVQTCAHVCMLLLLAPVSGVVHSLSPGPIIVARAHHCREGPGDDLASREERREPLPPTSREVRRDPLALVSRELRRLPLPPTNDLDSVGGLKSILACGLIDMGLRIGLSGLSASIGDFAIAFHPLRFRFLVLTAIDSRAGLMRSRVSCGT